MDEQVSASWQSMWDRLDQWVDIVISNLPNIVLAILIIGAFWWLATLSRRLSRKTLHKFFGQESIRMLVEKAVFIIVLLLGFLLALGILNLDTVVKSVLASAGVVGLAIGLALQGTLSNTFSGIYLAVKDIINVGDWIESNGFSGAVEKITLRNTFVKEPDNNLVILPNKMVLENPFKNYGLTTRIRVILKCGTGYHENLDKVREISINAIRDHFHQDVDDEVEFYYEEFGSSSINFMMRFWVEATEKMTILQARSDSIMVLKNAFDKNDISIPFPIRTIEFSNSTKDQPTEMKTYSLNKS